MANRRMTRCWRAVWHGKCGQRRQVEGDLAFKLPIKRPRKKTHKGIHKSVALPVNATKDAFSLLENWVRALRKITPCGTLQRAIIALVHGADAELPPDPVGAELRRIVPQPDELEAAPWIFLDELLAALDLEKEFILSSVMHARIPSEVRRRPSSASAVVHRSSERTPGQTFPKAFKNDGGGGMRITCASMQPWSAGQMPRSPRAGEVPGPGFYNARLLTRTLTNPLDGEFPSVGKARTCCPVNTLSVTTRFSGQIDTSRPSSAASRQALQRQSSSPGLGRGEMMMSQEGATESVWEKLLTA